MLLLARRRILSQFAAPLFVSLVQRTLAYSSMSSFVTERAGNTITVSPRKEADQSALVVISHGLGDTAEGFVDVAEHLAAKMPYVKFILPTAPTQPVTMNMGMAMPSWYDIKGLDERSNEDCAGLPDSEATLRSILETEHETTQLSYSRMVVGGFSQGGALSLFTGLGFPHQLAGLAVMSGYVPAVSQLQVSSANQKIPIWHGHGLSDPLVQFSMAEKSRELLKSKGVENYTIQSYPGLQHSVHMEEIGDLHKFLQQVLPPDETCRITLKDPSTMSVKELKAAIRKAGLSRQAVGLMEKSEFVKLLQDHYNQGT